MGFRSDDFGRVFVWNFKSYTRWWFQIFFISTSIWGKDQFCLIFFRWVVQPPTSIIFQETGVFQHKQCIHLDWGFSHLSWDRWANWLSRDPVHRWIWRKSHHLHDFEHFRLAGSLPLTAVHQGLFPSKNWQFPATFGGISSNVETFGDIFWVEFSTTKQKNNHLCQPFFCCCFCLFTFGLRFFTLILARSYSGNVWLHIEKSSGSRSAVSSSTQVDVENFTIDLQGIFRRFVGS